MRNFSSFSPAETNKLKKQKYFKLLLKYAILSGLLNGENYEEICTFGFS